MKREISTTEPTSIKEEISKLPAKIQKLIKYDFPEAKVGGYTGYFGVNGEVIFEKEGKYIIYHPTYENSSVPDGKSIVDIACEGVISQFSNYNRISTPLSVRKIDFSNNTFLPEKKYKTNNGTFVLINCDMIGTALPGENGYIKVSNDNINSISFKYKPIFFIKFYNNDGSVKAPISIISEVPGTTISDGLFFDFSSIKTDYITFTLNNNSESGFMEVL